MRRCNGAVRRRRAEEACGRRRSGAWPRRAVAVQRARTRRREACREGVCAEVCAQRCEACAGRCAHRGADADGRGTDLDGLDGILDLEEAALRREGVHAAVVLASGEEHLSVHARAAGCGQREGQREGQGRAGHRELPPLSALQLHVRAGGPLLSRWGRAGRRDCRSVAPSLTQLAALRPSLSCAALQTSPLCCLSLTRWPLRLHAASAAHRLAAPWHCGVSDQRRLRTKPQRCRQRRRPQKTLGRKRDNGVQLAR